MGVYLVIDFEKACYWVTSYYRRIIITHSFEKKLISFNNEQANDAVEGRANKTRLAMVD